MAEYFDSTVALAAIFRQSKNYSDARFRFSAARGPAYIINHGIAEVFRTLTGPLKLSPQDAGKLIKLGLLKRFKEAPLDRSDYQTVTKDMAARGLCGPIIYDALHAQGARKIKAGKVHTFNSQHFALVAPDLKLA